MAKLNRMADRLPAGGRLIFTDVPVLICEQGINKLDIDSAVAAADARYWWMTGLIPLRPTPPRPKTEEERRKEAEANKRAEETRKNTIQSVRRAKRVCILCGKQLGFLLKLRWAEQHEECSTFTE